MARNVRQMLKALLCLILCWFVGAAQFYLLFSSMKFSANSRNIPVVFTVGAGVALVLYVVYWFISDNTADNGKRKVATVVFGVIGGVVCMLCLVIVFTVFAKALTGFVPVSAVIEGVLLIAGQVLAYVLGKRCN